MKILMVKKYNYNYKMNYYDILINLITLYLNSYNKKSNKLIYKKLWMNFSFIFFKKNLICETNKTITLKYIIFRKWFIILAYFWIWGLVFG
jgi:hypothetical protein